MLIIIACLVSVFEALSQACIKASRVYQPLWFLVGLIGYTIISGLLYKAYSYAGIGRVNLLWSSLSIVLALLAGKIFFKEHWSFQTVLAVIFALIAAFLANHDKEEMT